MTAQAPKWYEEAAGFFGPHYLEDYEEVLTEERTQREVSFLIEMLNLEHKTRVLDIPCGHGRHVVELARRGFQKVVGYDLNLYFLATAEAAARKAGVVGRTRFKQVDMRNVKVNGGFDVVVNLFTAIGYFDAEADDVQFFQNVYRALRPGGLFLIDFINQPRLMSVFRDKNWRRLSDGSFVFEERSYEPLSGIMTDHRHRTREGGSVESVTTTLRQYTPIELRRMGERAGFTLKDAYGDFDGSPLTRISPRCILIFVKP